MNEQELRELIAAVKTGRVSRRRVRRTGGVKLRSNPWHAPPAVVLSLQSPISISPRGFKCATKKTGRTHLLRRLGNR